MRKFAAVAAAAVLLVGCGGSPDEPTVTLTPAPAPTPAPTPPPAPEPTPEPTRPANDFGDDPVLDRYWTACAAGNLDACDDLYWEAPLGSEYERFALEQMDILTPEPEIEIDSGLILSLTWASLTPEEQRDFCDGVDLFGAEFAAGLVADAADYAVSVAEIIPWIEEVCR